MDRFAVLSALRAWPEAPYCRCHRNVLWLRTMRLWRVPAGAHVDGFERCGVGRGHYICVRSLPLPTDVAASLSVLGLGPAII